MSAFFNGTFDDNTFNRILQRTVADLNNHKTLASSGSNYCRTEQWLRAQFQHTTSDLNHSHALLAIGIATSKPSADSPASESLKRYCALNTDNTGKLLIDLNGIDNFTAGSVFLDMYDLTGNQFYHTGAERMARYLINTYPKNKLGAMPYWSDHPNTMLVDDKGMVCGFLIRYGTKFKDPEALKLGILQLQTFLQHGMDSASGLPFHAFDVALDRKFGPTTWCRGIAWMVTGLADALVYLPKDHEARQEIAEALEKMLQTLRGYQEPEGCWRWDVNNPTAQLDTSGSAMIGCAIERAMKTGAIDHSWSVISEMALRGILRHTHQNGLVDHALADCNGVGHYPASFGPSNHAQGTTLALFALVRQRLSSSQPGR